MGKFVFSLQKVLEYKEQVEENARNEHASAARNVRIKKKEIKMLEIEKARHFKSYDCLGMSENGPERYVIYQNYFSYIENNINQKKQELASLEEIESSKMNAVIEAKKDRRSIELLKERKYKEFKAEETKIQEQLIEEFVSNVRS